MVTSEINQYLLITFTAGEIKLLKCVSASADLFVFPLSTPAQVVSQGVMRFRFSGNIRASSHSSVCYLLSTATAGACALQIRWGRAAGWQSPSEGIEQHLLSQTKQTLTKGTLAHSGSDI